jgi:hypothetical protein
MMACLARGEMVIWKVVIESRNRKIHFPPAAATVMACFGHMQFTMAIYASSWWPRIQFLAHLTAKSAATRRKDS